MSWSIAPLASPADLDAVLAIEEASFTNPWTREMYLAELEHEGVSFCYLARSPAGQVVGFCSFWIVLDEIHLNNLAVAPASRSLGVGAALMGEVLRQGSERGARRATLEVRRSNQAAQRLYARLGFHLAGVRRGYYSKPSEDALVLSKEIQAAGRP